MCTKSNLLDNVVNAIFPFTSHLSLPCSLLTADDQLSDPAEGPGVSHHPRRRPARPQSAGRAARTSDVTAALRDVTASSAAGNGVQGLTQPCVWPVGGARDAGEAGPATDSRLYRLLPEGAGPTEEGAEGGGEGGGEGGAEGGAEGGRQGGREGGRG